MFLIEHEEKGGEIWRYNYGKKIKVEILKI